MCTNFNKAKGNFIMQAIVYGLSSTFSDIHLALPFSLCHFDFKDLVMNMLIVCICVLLHSCKDPMSSYVI